MSRSRTCSSAFLASRSLLVGAIACASSLFLLLGGCFVTNTAPKTTTAANTSNGAENLINGKPPAPSLEIRLTPKELIFRWNEVEGASHYRLQENDGTNTGYHPVSGELTSTSFRQEIRFREQGWLKTRYLLEACNSFGCTSSKEISVGEQIHPAIGQLESPSPDLSDYFGITIALSADGTILAVGSPGEDSAAKDGKDNSLKESGAVYIFQYDKEQGRWNFHSHLKAAPVTESGRFGSTLAMSSDGNTLAVGAPLEAGGGAVYLFSRSGTTGDWSGHPPLKAPSPGVDGRFGFSLGLNEDGSILVIGAPAEQSLSAATDSDLLGAGAIYLYTRNDGRWRLQSRLEPSPVAPLARFGHAVAIDQGGTLVAAGAENWSSTPQQQGEGEGAVFLFSFDSETSSWSQQALLQAASPSNGSRFGGSLAISHDGDTLAVGAYRESGGRDIPHAGAVYLFRYTEGQWRQHHRIQAHNRGAHDEFGTALAFNQDASLLAVGAPFEDSSTTGVNEAQGDETGTNSGTVYLYSLSADKWRQMAYIKPMTERIEERSFGEFGTAIGLSSDSSTLAIGAPHLASRLLLTGEIIETLNAPLGIGLIYLYSPPAMAM